MKTVVKKVNYTCGETGAKASNISLENELRRSVLTCFLGQDIAYTSGETVKSNIKKLIPKIRGSVVAKIAIEARNQQKLRHVPLFIVREMCRYDSHKPYVADTLVKVIKRADELIEFLAIYWQEGKIPIAKQAKIGLAIAFSKFDEYSLAKYKKRGPISLRDVLFLVHAKPKDRKQEILWKKLVDNKLTTPDTWEVEISKSENKKESWTRLLTEKKLGALALLRNLRNMVQANVDDSLIRRSLIDINTEDVLPFRFLAAEKNVPRFKLELETAMLKSLNRQKKLSGKTVLIIDVSGSMSSSLSSQSQLSRLDAAIALSILLTEICEEIVVYATAGSDSEGKHQTVKINKTKGIDLKNEINEKFECLNKGGIFLKQATEFVSPLEPNTKRLIVISDSQDTSFDKSGPHNSDAFGEKNYLIDISCEIRGVAYNKFLIINGFSEFVVDYIQLLEEGEQKESQKKVKKKLSK